MKKAITLISIFITGILLSYGQQTDVNEDQLQGIWLGTMKVTEQMSLRIGYEIKYNEDGSFVAYMNVIEQKAFDLPMDECRIKNDSITLLWKQPGIVYEGVYHRDRDVIEGLYRQGGGSFDLVLSRVDKLPLEVNRPQTPQRPFPYQEEDIVFENRAAGVKLAGTITIPNEGSAFPSVILIAGSGPLDRNETEMRHFLLLSDFLTRNGFVVLRYDKRGIGQSTGNYDMATTFDFAEDAKAGIEYLKNRKEVDPGKIGLIGHSEGAMIASMIAAGSQNISYIVLMGGTGISGEDLLLIQAEYMARINGIPEDAIANLLEQNKQFYAIIRSDDDDTTKREKMRKVNPAIPEGQFDVMLKPWIRYFISYNPASDLEKVKCPVLAITGEKDTQCPPEPNLHEIEMALEKGGNKDYTIKMLPGLNHLFQTAKSGSPYEYEQIEEIMAPYALNIILEWLVEMAS